MKKKIFFICVLNVLFAGQLFAQVNKNGNPVFNSISTGERTLGKLLLVSNYYTLNNNIDNKSSSVFISENPTLAEIENAAINLPSDYYALTKDNKIVAMIMLRNDPERQFTVITIADNSSFTLPCELIGDITENRANELIREKYDPASFVDNGILTFNNKKLKIITGAEIEGAVVTIIEKQKLKTKKPSNITVLPQKDVRTLILSQTQENGKLDFFTPIKGKEYNSVQVKPGVYTSLISMALYMWGKACFELGVNTIDDAFDIFSEYKNRELNPMEKEMIKAGFDKKLEK